MRAIADVAGVHARLVGRLASVLDEAGRRPLRTISADVANRLLSVTVDEALPATSETHRLGDEARHARAMSNATATTQPVMRPRTRREAVDCVIDVAKLHALPLDAFVARQLDITPSAAQDLLRQARCDGLLPQSVRARRRA